MLEGVARNVKERLLGNFLCHSQQRHNKYFCQFYLQTEACAARTTTSNLAGSNGAKLKASEESGSALLRCSIQKSEQNNPDERRTVLRALKMLMGARSNDNLITKIHRSGVWMQLLVLIVLNTQAS